MTSFVRPPIFGIFLTYKESDHTGECNIDRPHILGGKQILPSKGVATGRGRGHQLIIWPKFAKTCMKMKKNWTGGASKFSLCRSATTTVNQKRAVMKRQRGNGCVFTLVAMPTHVALSSMFDIHCW